MTDDDPLHAFAVRAASGDEAAWDALTTALEPWLSHVVAQQRGVDRSELRNIVSDVLASMRANHFERLKLYLDVRERTRGLTLHGWLRVVAQRAGIDDARGDRTGPPSATVHEVLASAAMQLPEPQLSALELWVEGMPLEAIAGELGLGDAASTRTLVELAIAQLTRRQSCESCKLVLELVDARRSAEGDRRRQLSCARFELLVSVCSAAPPGRWLEEHLRECAPCRGVAASIIELSLHE